MANQVGISSALIYDTRTKSQLTRVSPNSDLYL